MIQILAIRRLDQLIRRMASDAKSFGILQLHPVTLEDQVTSWIFSEIKFKKKGGGGGKQKKKVDRDVYNYVICCNVNEIGN